MHWQYIAGFFDGEGHISRRKHNTAAYYTCVSQATTRRTVLDQIAEFLTQAAIPTTFATRKPCTSHPSGHTFLYVRGFHHVYNFLTPMLPYFIVKYDEAVTMINACAGAIAREADHHHRIALGVEAYKAGVSVNSIRKRYRVSHQTLYPILRTQGVHIRTRGDATRARFRIVS